MSKNVVEPKHGSELAHEQKTVSQRPAATSCVDIKQLKKQYSYYKHLPKLSEKQQSKLNDIINKLGEDRLPKLRPKKTVTQVTNVQE